ncbi:hypothetical protein Dsin_014197 [Dipteronia sinensis]|uniref:Uncharacterized protein n=1 Tax=Dipteronia sinensis TaxID=43782 RepID=A0AAE0AMJ0_9ROSI|nr:hypothetical protein Dsin_014197 [Dipteronia sinensis]
MLEQPERAGDLQQNVSPSLQPNHDQYMSSSNSDSEESINGLASTGDVQSNVSPSLRPNHNKYMSSSSSDSEESINGLASNLGESAHQSPLSEAQTAEEKFWTGERLNYYRPLHIAAQRGDWKSARSFIEQDPNALTAQITAAGRTVLHVAAYCWQWKFILKLLDLTSPESILVRTQSGHTILHFVAQGGSLKTAKALVQKNADLLQMANNDGELPLFHSISIESKELVWYLSLLTRVDSPVFPFYRPELLDILRRLIKSGYHGKK